MMLHAEEAIDHLRAAGMRLTPQRRAVLEALAGDKSHPLADDVAKRVSDRVPGISLSTVYKTLHEFASVGLIKELGLPGAMRFDADSSDHAHMVCDECGTVVDIPLTEEVSAALRDSAGHVTVTGIDVILHGSCGRCAPRRGAA